MTLWPILKTLYPENFKGGQCINFLHRFADFKSIGDSLQSKVANVYYYGTMAKNLAGNYKVGDLIITRESTKYGHGALINTIWGENLQLTESNFYGDERVHHGRLLNKNNPLIVGILKVIIKKMFIAYKEEISLVAPEAVKFVLTYQAWTKLGSPYAVPLANKTDYDRYPTAGIINDFDIRIGSPNISICSIKEES